MAMNSDRVTELAVEPERKRQSAFRIPEHVRSTHSPDGAAILDVLHGQMFRLNLAGSRILELLKQEFAEPEIAEQLANEFGIDRVLADADVREFLEMLEKHHLVTARAT